LRLFSGTFGLQAREDVRRWSVETYADASDASPQDSDALGRLVKDAERGYFDITLIGNL
jgi:hypothetical protein